MHVLNKKDRIRLLALLFIAIVSMEFIYGQTWQEIRELREYTPPDAIVSMDRHLSFDRAMSELNELSKKFTGKIIIDPEQRTKDIGIDIEAMHWRDAFERILSHNDIWYQERADHFLLEVPRDLVPKEIDRPFDPDRPSLRSREVNISAVFFEINHSKMRESGIRWNFFRSDGNFGDVRSGLNTARDPDLGYIDRTDRAFEVNVQPIWSFAQLDALVQLFEGTEIGEVIASPEVTVRSGQTGRIQIGEDISIKQRDFAGNIIDQFIETGTIIDVTPEVFIEDGIPFISLDISAERSSGTPGPISTVVAKAEAQTRVLLLDGEETVIGGLYIIDERMVREGIPVLKDLPWWFFGLKYLFGYNKIEKDKQELIILLKAQLVPTLEERFRAHRDTNLLNERRQRYLEDYQQRREAGEIK